MIAVMAIANASPTNKIRVTHVCNYAIYNAISEASWQNDRPFFEIFMR